MISVIHHNPAQCSTCINTEKRREARARHQHLRNIARGQFARLSRMHANLLELAELAAMTDRPVPEAALRTAREQYTDLLGAADDE